MPYLRCQVASHREAGSSWNSKDVSGKQVSDKPKSAEDKTHFRPGERCVLLKVSQSVSQSASESVSQ